MASAEAELHLPLYKVGDDIGAAIENEQGNVAAGLRKYAGQLDAAAAQVRELAKAADTGKLEVDADTHHVGVCGPADLIDALVRDGHLSAADEDDDLDEGDLIDLDEEEEDDSDEAP